ncbi:hypothetical protein [Luteibacter aegosomatissinici]|uniref:hypothetical protein n=1 Tax=Luteibacter aegosomatissinici TaxID=2911539 RepID=UPI001FF9A63F|nr:hypothetical protein [Luteibacter aegosomatissinici]UPG94556.1 hypothetical protein L2Y97_00180 [Luteibacter aegosomatissinici]
MPPIARTGSSKTLMRLVRASMKEAGLPSSAGVALTLPLVVTEGFLMGVDLWRNGKKLARTTHRSDSLSDRDSIGVSAAPLSTLGPVALVTSYSEKGIAAVMLER